MAAFPQFGSPRMPPEIQNLIWLYAVDLIPPRTVELRNERGYQLLDTQGLEPENDDAWLYDLSFTAHAPIPSFLHVCSRSREIAKRRWTLSFGAEEPVRLVRGGPITLDRIPKVWFDFERDTLVFMGTHNDYKQNYVVSDMTSVLHLWEREKVQTIAVNVVNLGFHERWVQGPRCARLTKVAFPNLKKLGIVFPFRPICYLKRGQELVPIGPESSSSNQLWSQALSLIESLREEGVEFEKLRIISRG